MGKLFSVLIGVVVAVVVVFGFTWYRYVTNTSSPYDEVGIELNSRMPAPLRDWGCARLKAHFAGALPPYGCQSADGKAWAVQ
ncbi:hypothetical protein [Inquilinus limosus]|uniref:Extensin n=1 Tax=Inquilinus limosus MP06 TaxID=1398085 RepID=A0A0A0CUM8_9PROT|nr:hypothetical protein [Inquilinus limosus]KGM30166.1 hypothetical protein P409_34720 [Inquilinus limosus MP06]